MNKKVKILILILFPIILMIGVTFFALSFGSQEGKVSLERKIDLPKNFSLGADQVAVIYFGYIGCHYVCLPAMNELKIWLNTLDIERQDSFAGYFVSLQPEVNQESVNAYAQSFHPLMRGKHVDSKTLSSLQKEFQFHWGKSPVDPYEINHTGFLYVLHKEKESWILKSIYITRPFNIRFLDEEVRSYLRS